MQRLGYARIIAGVCMCLGVLSSSAAQTAKGSVVTTRASGAFDVKVKPAPASDNATSSPFGRFLLDKQFHGDLAATSQGEMLAAASEVKGSAGYVALERVTGTLHGRRGSFILQHSGSMQGNKMRLDVSVVPDSGTDQLTGLAGTMTILIAADGTHSYELEYTISP